MADSRRFSPDLRSGRHQFEGDPRNGGFPGEGKLRPEDAVMRRLRREVMRLREERDILRRAIYWEDERSPRTAGGEVRARVLVAPTAP
jgi:transposase-like protein